MQDALGHLGQRKLIAVERASITAVPVYTVLTAVAMADYLTTGSLITE